MILFSRNCRKFQRVKFGKRPKAVNEHFCLSSQKGQCFQCALSWHNSDGSDCSLWIISLRSLGRYSRIMSTLTVPHAVAVYNSELNECWQNDNHAPGLSPEPDGLPLGLKTGIFATARSPVISLSSRETWGSCGGDWPSNPAICRQCTLRLVSPTQYLNVNYGHNVPSVPELWHAGAMV